jgi:hypothetical protein
MMFISTEDIDSDKTKYFNGAIKPGRSPAYDTHGALPAGGLLVKTNQITVSYGRLVPTGAYMNERLEISVEASMDVDPIEDNDLFHQNIEDLVDKVREAVDRQLPAKIDVKKEGYSPIKKYNGPTVGVSATGLERLKKTFGKNDDINF